MTLTWCFNCFSIHAVKINVETLTIVLDLDSVDEADLQVRGRDELK